MSGASDASRRRAQAALNDPSLYNLGNLLTGGLVELGKGALDSEEPLSLQHWLDSLGFGSALYGAYLTGKKSVEVRKGPAPARPDGSQPPPIGATGRVLDPDLLDELQNSGVKYSRESIVFICKTPEGKLLWLETGGENAGLQHIITRHGSDLLGKGVENITESLYDLLHTTPISRGRTAKGPNAVYIFNGKKFIVAYGDNGFIISFYPYKGK